MGIEDFEQEKKYRMPWWDKEVLDFVSAYNFKICTQYEEK